MKQKSHVAENFSLLCSLYIFASAKNFVSPPVLLMERTCHLQVVYSNYFKVSLALLVRCTSCLYWIVSSFQSLYLDSIYTPRFWCWATVSQAVVLANFIRKEIRNQYM